MKNLTLASQNIQDHTIASKYIQHICTHAHMQRWTLRGEENLWTKSLRKSDVVAQNNKKLNFHIYCALATFSFGAPFKSLYYWKQTLHEDQEIIHAIFCITLYSISLHYTFFIQELVILIWGSLFLIFCRKRAWIFLICSIFKIV